MKVKKSAGATRYMVQGASSPSMYVNTCMSVDFRTEHNGSDVVFIIEGKKLHAHKGLLKKRSEYFKCMFEGEFQEKDKKEIPLQGINFYHFQELLQFLYHCFYSSPHTDCCRITEHNCRRFLEFSEYYQMDFLRSKCKEFLIKSRSQETCLRHAYLAEKYNMPEVLATNVKKAKNIMLTSLLGNKYFQKLSSATQQKIKDYRIYCLERAIDRKLSQCKKRYTKVCVNGLCGPLLRQDFNEYMIHLKPQSSLYKLV